MFLWEVQPTIWHILVIFNMRSYLIRYRCGTNLKWSWIQHALWNIENKVPALERHETVCYASGRHQWDHGIKWRHSVINLLLENKIPDLERHETVCYASGRHQWHHRIKWRHSVINLLAFLISSGACSYTLGLSFTV